MITIWVPKRLVEVGLYNVAARSPQELAALSEQSYRDRVKYAAEKVRLSGTKIVMLTGDSERTAAAIAAQVGVDEYRAEVLPEDKAHFVQAERSQGRTVVMIGDGVNDWYRNQRRCRHRPGDRGHHHRGKRPVRAGAAAAAVHGPDEPHPVQLPLCHRLQRWSHRLGCLGRPGTGHLRHAP